VTERPDIDESVASLPAPVVERLLVSLVSTGRERGEVLDAEVVSECDEWDDPGAAIGVRPRIGVRLLRF
jgi:hypothetical protein